MTDDDRHDLRNAIEQKITAALDAANAGWFVARGTINGEDVYQAHRTSDVGRCAGRRAQGAEMTTRPEHLPPAVHCGCKSSGSWCAVTKEWPADGAAAQFDYKCITCKKVIIVNIGEWRLTEAPVSAVPEGAQEPDDALGLRLDMLDADRIREWARNIEQSGHDLTMWVSVPFFIGRLRELAGNVEQMVRDMGALRRQRVELTKAVQGNALAVVKMARAGAEQFAALRQQPSDLQVNHCFRELKSAPLPEGHRKVHWLLLEELEQHFAALRAEIASLTAERDRTNTIAGDAHAEIERLTAEVARIRDMSNTNAATAVEAVEELTALRASVEQVTNEWTREAARARRSIESLNHDETETIAAERTAAATLEQCVSRLAALSGSEK